MGGRVGDRGKHRGRDLGRERGKEEGKCSVLLNFLMSIDGRRERKTCM